MKFISVHHDNKENYVCLVEDKFIMDDEERLRVRIYSEPNLDKRCGYSTVGHLIKNSNNQEIHDQLKKQYPEEFI